MSETLVFSNITKYYNTHRALADVSFRLAAGELVALLGENGAGKTTTLQLISHLLTPDRGTITVMGETVKRASARTRQHIGYLAEQPFLYPTLSGLEFLEFVGALYRLSRAECAERGWQLLGELHLQDVAHQRIQSYSQGMRRRLALCATLIHRPSLLLLDEPLNGLDPLHIRTVKALLSELCATGCTILVSTHLLDVAERLCSRAIILSHGHVVADGDLVALRQAAHQSSESTLETVFFALTAEAEQKQTESAYPERAGASES